MLLLTVLAARTSKAQGAPVTSKEYSPSISPVDILSLEDRQAPEQNRPPQENHPRIFWILPTHTVVQHKNPTPLSSNGKWRLFVNDKTDPFTVGWVAFEAGISQATDGLSGYGQGAAGYGKRFGAGMTDEATRGFFGTFLFPSVLHQDPRYHRAGSGSFKRRLGHALIRPFLTHKDSGGRAFNWSGTLGTIAASGLSNAYYPQEDRGVAATFSRAAMSIPFSMIDELVNEFGPDLQRKVFGRN